MTATALTTLFALIIAHLVGDFLLQPRRWVEARQRDKARAGVLYLHAGIHGLLALAVLAVAGVDPLAAAAWSVTIAASHALIDLGKAHLDPRRLCWFLVDQALHLAVLLGVWLASRGSLAPLAAALDWLGRPAVMAHALAYLLVTRPLAIAIALAMRPWSEEVTDPGTLVAAGARIGILERLLVLTLARRADRGGLPAHRQVGAALRRPARPPRPQAHRIRAAGHPAQRHRHPGAGPGGAPASLGRLRPCAARRASPLSR